MFHSRRPFLIWLASCVALLASSTCLTSCGSAEPPTARAHFESLVGEWEGTHRILGYPDPFPATYTIAMDGDVVVHNFSSEFEGGFTGHERMTFAENGELVATWTDSGGDDNLVSRGSWDAETNTLTMRGEGTSWTDPEKTIQYRHVTVYGDDTTSYTMHMTEDGQEQEVMWIEMTRKK